MPIPLRVLILEDNSTDAELAIYEIKRAGFDPEWHRVQTEQEFVGELGPELDLILADYQLPQFDGQRALQCLQQTGYDIPFIIVSGAIGEELAVSLMKQGVTDYLQKDRLTRLGQAVFRALEQRRSRREKARAEQALRELAARMEQQAKTFDTLLSAVPDLLSLYGTDNRLTYANRALLDFWDTPLEQVVGKTFAELNVHPDAGDKYSADFAEALNGKTVRSETAYRTIDDRCGYHEYFLAPVFGDGRKVTAVACAARDITARKEAEEVLRRARETMEKQQQWLETVLDLLPQPVIMAEPGSGRPVFSNKAADRLYGGAIPKDSSPETLAQIFHFVDADGNRIPPEQTPAIRAARGERLDAVEARWQTPAGSFHMTFCSETLPPMYGHPPVAILLLQDITHLKEIEASLRESIEQLQRERELRDIFVSTLSHDLRTPLIAARMSAELLARRDAPNYNAALLQGRIIENIDRLDGMIQTLLDANLVRAGKRLPLQVDRCLLRQTVRDVLDELTTVHGDRYRLIAASELEGYWDQRFIRRIVENLVNNAVKYGDPEAPVTVTVEAFADGARIHVHNEGEPIKPEDQASLFEPFRRAAADPYSGKQGWGIGLTMVRGAVEAHGGQVSVESGPGRGTTFTVSLPKDSRPATASADD